MNPSYPFRAAESSPVLVTAAGERVHVRFAEFFTANIRNRNTRRAYARAVSEFLAWCENRRGPSITGVQPVHVAGYIEELTRARADRQAAACRDPPTVRLACSRPGHAGESSFIGARGDACGRYVDLGQVDKRRLFTRIRAISPTAPHTPPGQEHEPALAVQGRRLCRNGLAKVLVTS
jgi:hypothetical protein